MPSLRAPCSLALLLAAGAPAAVGAAREADLAQALDVGGLEAARGRRAAGGPAPAPAPAPPAPGGEALQSYSREERRENGQEASVQERAEKKDGFLITCMLIGFILFDVTLLYLLNSSDPQVRAYSFKMVSTGVVVFCALLVENLQEQVLRGLAGLASEHAALLELLLFALAFGLWFFLISWGAWRLRARRQDQHCALSLAAHVGAFAALEYVGELQERTAARWLRGGRGGGPALRMYLGAPLLVWLGFRACSAAADALRLRCLEGAGAAAAPEGRGEPGAPGAPGGQEGRAVQAAEAHGRGRGHGRQDWKAEAVHAECDGGAIVVGFLVKQCVVYVITAHPVPMDCAKYPVKCHVGSSSMGLMLLPVLAIYLALIPTAVFHARRRRHQGWLLRLELLLGMTLSWLVLQMSEWETVHLVRDLAAPDSPLHAKTVKKLLCASVLSPLLVLVILHVDALADWDVIDPVSAEATMQCIAFLIGFYWEKVFMSAIKNVTRYSSGRWGTGDLAPRLLLGLLLLGSIMPAWRWFLVPVACEPVPPRDAGQKSVSQMLLRALAMDRAGGWGPEEGESVAPRLQQGARA